LTPNFRKALTKLEVPVDADGKLILPVKLKISGELTFNEPFTSPVDLKEAGLFNFNTIGTPGKVIAQPPVIKVPKTGKITPQAVELVSETKAAAAAGVGSQVPPGVMYNRVTFDKITKTPDFKLQFFWEITF
ncbi:MAG TPA: hypothetical protein PK228_18635, partial [Saprospiraceae bacterium]|nr:hypothetical protein [Saprospiraceae bacterium]